MATISKPKSIPKQKPKNYDFVLSRYIMEHSDFTGVIVFGGQRVGKSSYALQVLYDIYRDWNKVLDLTFFTLESVVKFLRAQVKKDKPVSAVLWDDSGVYGNSQLYFTQRRLAQFLQSLFDTVGVSLKGVIMTTPSPENLLKSLRSYEFYRTKVLKQNSYHRRIARGYRNIVLPSGTRYIQKRYEDFFDVRLPDWVFEEYIQIRKGYLDSTLDDLDNYLSKIGLGTT